jgi:hypothetical protein
MSSNPILFERASAEIVALHRFFVEWYNVPTAATADFSRFERAMGEGFHMIPPDGRVLDRAAVLGYVRGNRGTAAGDFAIDIEDIRAGWESDGTIVVIYVEAQLKAGKASRRQASALFTTNPSAPGGVEWRHLHETWLQMPET